MIYIWIHLSIYYLYYYLQREEKLQRELLRILIPVGPEFAGCLVNFLTLDFERYGLVRFRSDEQILMTLVRCFNFLLIS